MPDGGSFAKIIHIGCDGINNWRAIVDPKDNGLKMGFTIRQCASDEKIHRLIMLATGGEVSIPNCVKGQFDDGWGLAEELFRKLPKPE